MRFRAAQILRMHPVPSDVCSRFSCQRRSPWLLSPVWRVGSEMKTMELDAEQRLKTVLGRVLTDLKVQASGTPRRSRLYTSCTPKHATRQKNQLPHAWPFLPQHTLISITWPERAVDCSCRMMCWFYDSIMNIWDIFKNFFKLHVFWGKEHATFHIRGPEDKFCELVFSFHHVGCWDLTQVHGLGSQCLYSPSHHTDSPSPPPFFFYLR